MNKSVLAVLKIGAMMMTFVASIIAVLYLLDVVAAENTKKLLLKTMIIMGIVVANFLVVIILSGQKAKNE